MTTFRERRSWWFTVALLLPVVVLYLGHYSKSFDGSGQRATGFVQYDMPYYLANAREYLDGGSDGLLYAQPFSYDIENHPIYFQPQILALGLAWRLTGMDPGTLFVLFGITVGVLCIRVWQRVLEAVAPSSGGTRVFGDVLFVWGGGLLVAAGVLVPWLTGAPPSPDTPAPFQYDPQNGWWFLNLGRNLVYPFEAYYHLLFFAAVLALLRQRYWIVAALLALLAASHPFTGVAALLIFGSWAFLERFYVGNRDVPLSLVGVLGATLVVAGLYYGWWLPRDVEHRALMQQWALPWEVDASTFVPAYALVAGVAVARLRTASLLREFLASPTNRFLTVWVMVNFALENHEFAITPHQPIHFTRGYVWGALFLIGAPWLLGTVVPWLRRRGRAVLLGSAVAILVVGSFDNAVWFAVMTGVERRSGAGIALSRDDQLLFERMNVLIRSPQRLIAQSERIGYLAAVYTPLRPYVGHPYNTPFVDAKRSALRALFRGQVVDTALQAPAWVLADKSQPFRVPMSCVTAYENDSYLLCHHTP